MHVSFAVSTGSRCGYHADWKSLNDSDEHSSFNSLPLCHLSYVVLLPVSCSIQIPNRESTITQTTTEVFLVLIRYRYHVGSRMQIQKMRVDDPWAVDGHWKSDSDNDERQTTFQVWRSVAEMLALLLTSMINEWQTNDGTSGHSRFTDELDIDLKGSHADFSGYSVQKIHSKLGISLISATSRIHVTFGSCHPIFGLSADLADPIVIHWILGLLTPFPSAFQSDSLRDIYNADQCILKCQWAKHNTEMAFQT